MRIEKTSHSAPLSGPPASMCLHVRFPEPDKPSGHFLERVWEVAKHLSGQASSLRMCREQLQEHRQQTTYELPWSPEMQNHQEKNLSTRRDTSGKWLKEKKDPEKSKTSKKNAHISQ